jgi:hypothetical protein
MSRTRDEAPAEWEQLAVSRAGLWFGLLGGGVAWLTHLLASYVIAEFGCLSNWGQNKFLGVTWLAWLLLGVSFLTLGWAGVATYVAYRSKQRLGNFESSEGPTSAVYMARAGYITSGVFLFIILVESVPIFFFLQSC